MFINHKPFIKLNSLNNLIKTDWNLVKKLNNKLYNCSFIILNRKSNVNILNNLFKLIEIDKKSVKKVVDKILDYSLIIFSKKYSINIPNILSKLIKTK